MEVEKYEVKTDKISSNSTLAVVTDLHLRGGGDNTRHLKSLLETISDITPAYICLVGDYAAGHSAKNNFLSPEAKKRLLRYLHALREIAPIIMSLGNHDVSQGMDEELRKEFLTLEEDDIHPVDRTQVFTDESKNINFLGYMQPHDAYAICDMNRKKRLMVLDDIRQFMPPAIKDGNYNIGLIHTPIIARDKFLLANGSPTQQLDLILSGHHHQGLLDYRTIDTINKAVTTLQKIFPGHREALEKLRYLGICENPLNHPLPFINLYARGMHEFGGVPTIISRGAGNESASGPKRDNPKNQFVTQVDIIKQEENASKSM